MDGTDKTTDENALIYGKLYQNLKGFYGRIKATPHKDRLTA